MRAARCATYSLFYSLVNPANFKRIFYIPEKVSNNSGNIEKESIEPGLEEFAESQKLYH